MIKLPVGGALPGFAQLAVSTYHAATASSHSTISKVIMQVEERGSNPLPPVGESPSTVPSTKGSLSQKSWVHFLTCYEILGMYSNLEPRCFISPVVSKKRGINASVQRLSRANRPLGIWWFHLVRDVLICCSLSLSLPFIVKKALHANIVTEGNQDLYLELEQKNLNSWLFLCQHSYSVLHISLSAEFYLYELYGAVRKRSKCTELRSDEECSICQC